MKISELIKILQELHAQHGDVPVAYNDDLTEREVLRVHFCEGKQPFVVSLFTYPHVVIG